MRRKPSAAGGSIFRRTAGPHLAVGGETWTHWEPRSGGRSVASSTSGLAAGSRSNASTIRSSMAIFFQRQGFVRSRAVVRPLMRSSMARLPHSAHGLRAATLGHRVLDLFAEERDGPAARGDLQEPVFYSAKIVDGNSDHVAPRVAEVDQARSADGPLAVSLLPRSRCSGRSRVTVRSEIC